MTPSEKKKRFNQELFRFHKTHYRDMPWRNTHDPYRILVSEVMLQQTQVDRVRTYYALFLKKFPSVRSLARAPLGDVLRVWSGLGYNRRAKYLHACAKMVIAEYRGKFPDDMNALKSFPGIGLSTAAALSAFAFEHDEPMIDTNIRRILIRIFYKGQTFGKGLTFVKIAMPSDKELYVFAKTLIPKGRGRMWNYAMLDVGATKCTARHHAADCPFVKLHGAVSDFVYKKPQKKFAHSNRFYRGRILAMLTQTPQMSVTQLSKALLLSSEEISVVVLKLIAEKLIMRKGNVVRLP